MTKAHCPQVTQCWLTLACAEQLPPPGFVIMKRGKEKEGTDFAALHNKAGTRHRGLVLALRIIDSLNDLGWMGT